MSKKVFLIGIGGTGMRCLESFIHTCACGMFDDTEVHMLALDTDEYNGNFKRLQELQSYYQKLNGGDDKPKKDTFFSASLHFYKFCPAYSGQSFEKQTNYGNTQLSGEKAVSDQLIDLFMDEDVRTMSLEHGYRAQTQMGSLLMYYAIQKAAYEAQGGDKHQDFRKFIEKLAEGQNNPVFVFGSVFGGTGASSIPIIALALDKAANIMGHPHSITNSNYFGTIILTNYFSFSTPNKPGERIIAKSDNFSINSQAALMFYNEDHTVKEVYKRMYILGRSNKELRNISDGNAPSDTGGEKQKNPADFIELMAALAVKDFVKECESENPFSQKDEKFFCIGHDFGNGLIDFPLFAQSEADTLKKKLGALVAASVLNLDIYNFFNNICDKKEGGLMVNIEKDGTEMRALKKYFDLFNISFDENGNIVKGWLPQMYSSRKVMFAEELFQCRTRKELEKFKLGETLFAGENAPSIKVGSGIFSSYPNKLFTTVKDKYTNIQKEKDQGIINMMSRTYSTLMELFFNES